jgi:hypothetical protein
VRRKAGGVCRATKQSHAIQGEDAKFAIASPPAADRNDKEILKISSCIQGEIFFVPTNPDKKTICNNGMCFAIKVVNSTFK